MSFLPITHSVSVYRLLKTGNKEDYGTTPTATGLDCGIVPAGNDIVAVYPDIPAYALYEVYVHESFSFKIGDKLVDVSSNEYILRGVPQVYDLSYGYYQRLVCEKVV